MTPTQAQPVEQTTRAESLAVYFGLGVFIGVIFLKSEVASWFRIQEMFRFHAIHMYGVIGSAIAVGALSTALMKHLGVRTIRGENIAFPSREAASPQSNHILGGTLFGLGWGLVGACPGPFFALIGSGVSAMLFALLGALGGAWAYAFLKPRLPH